MAIKKSDPYVPLKEAVLFLGLTEQTVRRMAERGELEFIRDSNGERRYLRSSLRKYLRGKEARQ